jgi:hypothetical protein
VVDVSAGEYATMLIKRDGTLVAVNTTQPVGLTNVVAASPGFDNVAVLADGRIYCWNANSSYFIEGITNAIAVASGEWAPVALLKTGEVIQWEIHNRQPGKFAGITNAVEVGYYRFAQVRLATGQVIPFGIDARGVPAGLRAVSSSVSIGAGAGTTILPYFDQHPPSQQVFANATVTMKPAVRAVGNVTFQWLRNGVPITGATNISLTITNVAQRDGGTFVLRATNGNATAESLPATLTVTGLPEIISQTATVTVDAGTELNLAVEVASSSTVTYQWSWNRLPIAGATNAAFRIASAQAADAGAYEVVVKNASGSVRSAPVVVTVNAVAPSFIEQPADVNTADGQPAEFTARARGSAPITFQWFHGNEPITGETNLVLRIENVQANDAGTYHVVASNALGVQSSQSATLTRSQAAPAASVEPSFRLARIGKSARFDALIRGTEAGGATYQWIHDGTNLPLQTNAWLTIETVSTNDAGNYKVVAENSLGTAESESARLHILPAKATGVVRSWGGAVAARPPEGLLADDVAQSSTFGAALLPDGSVTNWGSIRNVPVPPIPPEFNQMVSLATTATALIGLRDDGTVAVWEPSGISDFTAGASNVVEIAAGTAQALAVRTDGTVLAWPGSSVTNFVPTPATNVAMIAAAASRYLVMRKDGSFYAWAAPGSFPASFNPPAAATNVVAIATSGLQYGALRRDGVVLVWGTPTSVPGNSNFVALVAGQSHFMAMRTNGTISLWGNATDGQLVKPADVTNIVGIAAGAVSSHAMVTTPRILSIPGTRQVTEGSTMALTVTAVAPGTLKYQWLQNNVAIPGATDATVNLPVTASSGGSYSVIVSNEFTSIRSGTFNVIVGIPPKITTQPVSTVVLFGQSAQLSVVATGSPNLTYQWYRNGEQLVGGISPVLTVTNVHSFDRGSWTVRVSNSYGSVESVPVELLAGPPAIASPQMGTPVFTADQVRFSAVVQPEAVFRLQTSTNLFIWRDERLFFAPTATLDYVAPRPTNEALFYRLISP